METRYILVGVLLVIQGTLEARSCFTSADKNLSISGDCEEISIDCEESKGIRTFIRPRSITSDLTYRNSMTFYQRFRGDASCSVFTFDSTYLFQANTKATHVGRGYLGANPLIIAEHDAPVNSLNLGLGSRQPEGFSSIIRLSPKRRVFGWLPQLIIKLDEICDGLWADIACAVVKAEHKIHLFEQTLTPGDMGERTTVKEAFDALGLFPTQKKHTGVDDIEMRLGYTVPYCEDDMFSIYLLGSIPTGKKFDNSRWFEPLVGSRSGGLGAGIFYDSTWWYDEFAETEWLFMSELKYVHYFSTCEQRLFDLKNGPLSRFLLVTQENDRNNPKSASKFLRHEVTLKAQDSVDWWVGIHYVTCNWGIEASYDLWYRSKEQLTACNIGFDSLGIYDMTRCDDRTSHSTARISDGFGQGTPDALFTRLTADDVQFSSAAAGDCLSHTLAGVVTYHNEWCCVPYSIALGTRYEFASHGHHTSTFENWGIYGKVSVSC